VSTFNTPLLAVLMPLLAGFGHCFRNATGLSGRLCLCGNHDHDLGAIF